MNVRTISVWVAHRINPAIIKKANQKNFVEPLAEFFFLLYNGECWSLTAMKREVTDTPGRFAMASDWKIFVENVYPK
jgi:hypothetical protein